MKLLLFSVLFVFVLGSTMSSHAQIPIPQIADDPVVGVYIGILITILVVIIPSIIFTYKKFKKDSKKHPQTKLTDSGFQPNVNLVCSKCGFETDDKDTFEMHHRDEKFMCIKSWAGRKYYGGKWLDKNEKKPSTESTLLESENRQSHEKNELKKIKEDVFCTHCGNPLPITAKFCGKCGKSIKGQL